jgi:hypothetical protein
MLIFRVPVWRNVTSCEHVIAHHVEASGLFWVSRKHSLLVFVAVAHPVKLFNWVERSLGSLAPAFRSRRMVHFDPNEHDCNRNCQQRSSSDTTGKPEIIRTCLVASRNRTSCGFLARFPHFSEIRVYQDPRLNWENQNSGFEARGNGLCVLVHVELF